MSANRSMDPACGGGGEVIVQTQCECHVSKPVVLPGRRTFRPQCTNWHTHLATEPTDWGTRNGPLFVCTQHAAMLKRRGWTVQKADLDATPARDRGEG